MDMARSIVSWEILRSGALHSCFDGLLGYLGFLGWSPIHTARVLPSFLFLVSITVYFLAFSWSRKEHDTHTRAALRTLLAVIAPACSLWPSRYVHLARILHPHIDLPLDMIIEDTTDGVIEFRDPINDLVALIGPGITAHGRTVRTNIGWKWWISYFEWWMLAKFTSGRPSSRSAGYMFWLSEQRNNDMPTSSPSGLPLSPFTPALSTSCPLFCLDYLPLGVIPVLNLGCRVTLEFTTFSPSLRALGTARIISATPFIFSEHSTRRPRTLVSVLRQLSTSYGSNLVVDSISNVSADYEVALRRVHESFSGEQTIRETWIENMGIKAWRRGVFLVALEAALLRRGWIERWAVQITTK